MASVTFSTQGTQLDNDEIADLQVNESDRFQANFTLDTSGLDANLQQLEVQIDQDFDEIDLSTVRTDFDSETFEIALINSFGNGNFDSAILQRTGEPGAAPNTINTIVDGEVTALDGLNNDGQADLGLTVTKAIDANGNDVTDLFEPATQAIDLQPSPQVEKTFGTKKEAQSEVDSYTVDDLFVFGDRLTENGGEFGRNAVAESTGANPPYDFAPYSPLGNFTNDLNWTSYLADSLGVDSYANQDTNFSYLDGTARELVNPFDPFGEATDLNTFTGQIDTFEETYGTFTENDLVVVNFGGNDLTLPPEEGVAPEDAAQQSIQATVDGIARLQALGAENFLVGLVPPVELAPIFSDPEFQAIFGVESGLFDPVVDNYNQGLTAALDAYEMESGANIEIFDLNTLFDDIAADPEAFGFVNVEEPVLISQTPLNGEAPVYNPALVGQDRSVQDATLFIDPFFHPTALGHSIVAEAARDELFDLGEADGATYEETDLTVGLYDTDSDTLIAPLENGTQISASEIAGKNLTISASVPEDSIYSQVESVLLDLNDGRVTQTENHDPYTLFGNDGEDLKGGIDLQGQNTIAFELYSQDELGGEVLGNVNIDFSIV